MVGPSIPPTGVSNCHESCMWFYRSARRFSHLKLPSHIYWIILPHPLPPILPPVAYILTHLASISAAACIRVIFSHNMIVFINGNLVYTVASITWLASNLRIFTWPLINGFCVQLCYKYLYVHRAFLNWLIPHDPPTYIVQAHTHANIMIFPPLYFHSHHKPFLDHWLRCGFFYHLIYQFMQLFWAFQLHYMYMNRIRFNVILQTFLSVFH